MNHPHLRRFIAVVTIACLPCPAVTFGKSSGSDPARVPSSAERAMTGVGSESAMVAALFREGADRYLQRADGRGGCQEWDLLHTVVVTGPDRVLHIRVDPQRDDVALMTAIARELQHAVAALVDDTNQQRRHSVGRVAPPSSRARE